MSDHQRNNSLVENQDFLTELKDRLEDQIDSEQDCRVDEQLNDIRDRFHSVANNSIFVLDQTTFCIICGEDHYTKDCPRRFINGHSLGTAFPQYVKNGVDCLCGRENPASIVIMDLYRSITDIHSCQEYICENCWYEIFNTTDGDDNDN